MSGNVKAEPFSGPFDVFVGNADGRGLIRIETAHDAPEAGNVVATMVRNARSEATAVLFVTAVNSYASSQAEIERLRAAHLSIGELPTGMISKIVGEIVSWGDQCAGGSGREIIPSGPNAGKPYGHTYYEAAAALAALFEDARTALGTKP